MCTLIANITPKKILLMENRDESPKRPHRGFYDSDSIFYPALDEDNGLTWIGMSKDGTVAALLNHVYGTHKGTQSRGLIVPDVLKHPTHSFEASASDYSPFQLLVAKNGIGMVHRWDGQEYDAMHVDGTVVLAASSYSKKHGIDVAAWRVGQVEEMLDQPFVERSDLEEIARAHLFDTELSPCMHGEWSRTLCSSIVEIDSTGSRFYMLEGQPCEGGEYELKKEFPRSR